MKNEVITGECIDITREGFGVVKVGSFPYFLKNVLIGEQVKFVVTLLKKNFGYGKPLEYLSLSPERVHPRCPLFPQCGGCQLQQMSSNEQARFKETLVKRMFYRNADMTIDVKPIKAMDKPWNYRNKVMIPFQDNPYKAGFYRVNSHDIIDMDVCEIQSDVQNRLYAYLKPKLKDLMRQFPVRTLMMREAMATKQFMLVFVLWKRCEIPKILLKDILETFPEMTSIQLCFNTEEGNTLLTRDTAVVYGEEFIEDVLLGLTYQISMHSFYQINPIQTEILYQTAIDYAQIKPEDTVLDLYCGIGTIGSTIAKQTGAKVIGIEVVPEAIEDARNNAKRNGLENIEFICADARKGAQHFAEAKQTIDVIVVDPPRKGCDRETLDAIIAMKPRTLVYVSCDPATLARDVRLLVDGGFRVEEVQPVDMFPQTKHVECITLLTRK